MRRAISQLTRPNKLVSDAVDARMELDLRIGASFTRFQTLRLKKRFPQAIPQGGESTVVSYGSCQFPTLGFVVERFKQREAFLSEPFWKIVVTRVHDTDKKSVEFAWERVRLFDYQACLSLYEKCIGEEPVMARVVEVKTKPKSKWRPCALDTVVSVLEKEEFNFK
jgi:DNA topoisomerase-3